MLCEFHVPDLVCLPHPKNDDLWNSPLCFWCLPFRCLIPKRENFSDQSKYTLRGAALKGEHARKQEPQVLVVSSYHYVEGDCKNLVQERVKSDITMRGSLMSIRISYGKSKVWSSSSFQLLSMNISISICSCSCIASKQVVVLILYYHLLLWLCCHQSSKRGRL